MSGDGARERNRVLVRLAAALTAEETAWIAAMDEAVEVSPDEAEEVLLQSYIFLGFPVALNALGLWRRRTGRPAPEARDQEPSLWAERGEAVCRQVYAQQYEALRAVMEGVHPDLDQWALREGYGKVLGRPGLDLPTRELCVAAMLSGIDATRQLHAHLRGCLNVGAPVPAVEAMLEDVEDLIGTVRATMAGRVWQKVRDRYEENQRTGTREGERDVRRSG